MSEVSDDNRVHRERFGPYLKYNYTWPWTRV